MFLLKMIFVIFNKSKIQIYIFLHNKTKFFVVGKIMPSRKANKNRRTHRIVEYVVV